MMSEKKLRELLEETGFQFYIGSYDDGHMLSVEDWNGIKILDIRARTKMSTIIGKITSVIYDYGIETGRAQKEEEFKKVLGL